MAHDVARMVLQGSSTAYSLVKDTFSYMNNKAKSVEDLEENLSNMIEQVARFYSRKKDIDLLLEISLSKERNDEYNLLVKRMEGFLTRFKKFVDKYGKYYQNLPSFDVSDISSVENMIEAIQQIKPTILSLKFLKLSKLSEDMKKLSNRITPIVVHMTPERVLRDKGIEVVEGKYSDIDIASFDEYVGEIMKCLRKEENKSIGILGRIGVGKTAVLKKLNNELGLEFGVVIWVDCDEVLGSGDNAIEGIQDVIIARLKLNQEKTNIIYQNAGIISKALSERKYVLLVDQVSAVIELNKVGIHRNHKFGKIVVASSNKRVIAEMTNKNVEIQNLLQDDAWDLFEQIHGEIYDSRIKVIAKSVVNSCDGLPLVIKLVANHLKGENDENVWSCVKSALTTEAKSKLNRLDALWNAYQFLYDKLEDPHKNCLLFVTLFPSNHKIYKDYLVECWNAERLLGNDVQDLRSARENGALVLRELGDQYLLENNLHNLVKMPEFIRKVIVEQEYSGEDNSQSWRPGTQPLTKEVWMTTKRMSLIRYKTQLPQNPENTIISTLLMQCNDELVALGGQFFLNMKKLQILDLHQTKIKFLPSSISCLVSLVSLYLNDCCKLTMLPQAVEKLENLELLDIRGTSIRSLPTEIRNMSKLRCLRISFSSIGCSHGKSEKLEMAIPVGIIQHLTCLEELIIEVGCCSKTWENIAEQIVNEIACLEKLSTLDFHFPRVRILSKFLSESRAMKNMGTHRSTNTFRSFKLSVGCCEMKHPYSSDICGIYADRQLKFGISDELRCFTPLVGELLQQASSFEFVNHSGVTSMSDFKLETAGTLKVFVVENCEDMVTVVDTANCVMLQCLEKLHLFNLQSLQSIWKGQFFQGILANLKVQTLVNCPELSVVLNLELAKALSNLEYLRVEDCSKVEKIIQEEKSGETCSASAEIIEEEECNGQNTSNGSNSSHMLNKVMTIELVNLPRLERICSTSMKWGSLVNIEIISCNELGDFDLILSGAEKLKKIKCEASWWSSLQLSNEHEQRFRRLCDLKENLANRAYHEGESSKPERSNASVKEEISGHQHSSESSPDDATHHSANANEQE